MSTKTSPRSSSRSTSNGSEGAAIPPGGALPPFPVDSFKDAAPHLRRPFAPDAVRFKVQTGTMVVPYIDARLVIERLNAVCPHLWSAEYRFYGERPDTNRIICDLTIDGLTRTDVGVGQGQTEDVKVKGAYSDALKRAAVHFGVGVSLYAMSQVFLSSGTGSKDEHGIPTLKADGKTKNGKPKYKMTAEAEHWLRTNYEKWLGTDRGKHFGDALDHGDSPGAIGDPVEVGEPESDHDLALAAHRAEIEKAYKAKIAAGAPKSKFTKGKFDAQLRQADTPEKLDELEAKVKGLADA